MLRHWIALVSLVCPRFLLAQAAPQDQPRGDMFIGYAYAQANVGSSSHYGLHGFEWSNDHNLRPWLAITEKVDFFWGNTLVPFCFSNSNASCETFEPKQGTGLSTIMGGLRLSKAYARATPFARALVGLGMLNSCPRPGCESKYGFSEDFGAGLQVRITERRFGWRFEGDLLQTRFFGAWQNDFRLATGPVIYFYKHK